MNQTLTETNIHSFVEKHVHTQRKETIKTRDAAKDKTVFSLFAVCNDIEWLLVDVIVELSHLHPYTHTCICVEGGEMDTYMRIHTHIHVKLFIGISLSDKWTNAEGYVQNLVISIS